MALRWYETPQDINMEEEPNASKCLKCSTLKILKYWVKNIKTSFELITCRPVAGAVTPIYYAL